MAPDTAAPQAGSPKAAPGINGKAYEIVDHQYDVVVVGAGGAGLNRNI